MEIIKRYTLICYDKRYTGRYLISSCFKDICLYLAQNKLPNTKPAIRKVEDLAEKCILLDLLLFKIISTPEKEMRV